MSPPQISLGYRFGPYELDLGAAKLRRHGIRVRLSKLPFQALLHLVENPGRLVSRDDLHGLLWGNEIATDFDDKLNHVIQRIREALIDDPNNPRFIETAPGMGYRFIAEVSPVEAVEEQPALGSARNGNAVPGMTKLTWALVAFLLVVGPAIWAVWSSAGIRAPRPGNPSIVVLPFENLGDPEDEYFADGMTEEIISRLAGVDGLSVVSRTSAMQYKLDRPPLKQIGLELGAHYVLEGTVRWQRSESGRGRVRVTPQLVEVSTDKNLWAESYDSVLTDIFQVQSDIASQVLENLDIVLLEPQRHGLETWPTENADAYDVYLRGNEYFHRAKNVHAEDPILIAIRMYQEAIDLDPGFALAHARQAIAHAWLAFWGLDRTHERLELAKAAAQRALNLAPDTPDVHLALGLIRSSADRDWDGALDEYRIALRGKPGDMEVMVEIAEMEWFLGRWNDSLTTLEKAIENHPRQGRLACFAGGRAFGLRDYKKALRLHDRAIQLVPDRTCPYMCKTLIYLNSDGEADRALEFLGRLPPTLNMEGAPPINYPWVVAEMLDGKFSQALDRLSMGTSEAYDWVAYYVPKDLLRARIYGLMGRPTKRQEHYEKARRFLEGVVAERPKDSRPRGPLGVVYAALGRREDAIQQGKLGLELLAGARNPAYGYSLRDMARIHTMLGEKEEAIDLLDQLLSDPTFFSAAFLNVDPTLEPLRENRRFKELIKTHSGDPAVR